MWSRPMRTTRWIRSKTPRSWPTRCCATSARKCILGTLFLVGSTFTLAKTMRDEFEASKLINKLAQARTEKLLKEYGQES